MSKASITSISMLSDLIAGLENELQNPLPGKAGQVKSQ
jgi:hypothetical protein